VPEKLAGQSNTNQADLRPSCVVEGDFGKQLGSGRPTRRPGGHCREANYGRNLRAQRGPASALKLDRAENRQWTEVADLFTAVRWITPDAYPPMTRDRSPYPLVAWSGALIPWLVRDVGLAMLVVIALLGGQPCVRNLTAPACYSGWRWLVQPGQL